MFRYRIIYVITLAASILFYFVYQMWFSWYLLVLLLALIPLDLLVSLPGMFSKSVRISAPSFLEKDTGGFLSVTAIKKRPFPVRCLYLRINVLGDDFTEQCSALIPTSYVNQGIVDIDTSRTGLTIFEVRRLHTVSLMGLFSFPFKDDAKATVLVLPPPQKPRSTMDFPKGMALVPKPGGGFSEEHDMRNYRLGDPLKSIHWKLSAKYDELIIREPLVPPHQSRLIHVMPWDNAVERDSVLSHLRWVSNYLIGNGMPYYIKFGERPIIEEITREADLIMFLTHVLDNSAIIKPTQLPKITRFSWTYIIKGTGTVVQKAV